MDSQQVRRDLEKELGRNLTWSAWEYLNTHRYVSGFLEGRELWEDVVFEVKRQLMIEDERDGQKAAGSESSDRRKSRKRSKEIKLDLRKYEKSRAEAFGEYIALGATLFPGVQEFREEFLGGTLLTAEQAHHFVHSPINQVFGPKWFEREGIDPSAHVWRWLYPLDAPRLTGKGHLGASTYPLLVCPPDKVYIVPEIDIFGDAETLSFPAVTEDYSYAPERIEQIDAETESILYSLKILSSGLAEDYSNHAWEEAQAAWFVLTGEATPANALMARIQGGYSYGDLSNAKVTLEVQPWVSAETVSSAYREIQQILFNKSHNRRIDERSLTLLRFVVRRLRDSIPKGGMSEQNADSLRVIMFKAMELPFNEETRPRGKYKKPTWVELTKQWNRTQKNEWGYKDYRNLRRAFYNVATLVAGSDYIRGIEGFRERRIRIVPWPDQKEQSPPRNVWPFGRAIDYPRALPAGE